MLISLLISLLSITDTLQASSVTASYISKDVPVQVLRGEELQSLSSSSVADALKFFAGVQIKDYGGLGGQKTINVRSLGTQHTGVYIDGVRITNCQNGTVDLGKYSLVNMESVELYNSNKVASLMTASEYASASTVYLKTKRPTKSSLLARYKYSSFNTHKAQIHGSYKNHFFGDVEFDHSDGNYPFVYHSQYEDTVGVRKNSDITFLRAEAGYFTDHLTTHLYLYSSERGLPGGIVKRLSDKYGDIGRESDINSFLQASYINSWNSWSLKVNSKYAYDYLHANTNFVENQFVKYDNHYHQQDFYLALATSYSIPFLVASASTDLRLSDLNCDVYGMSYVARLDTKTVFDTRFYWNGLTADASCLFTYVKDFSNMKVSDPLYKFTPSFHISYSNRISNLEYSVRAFYKTIFRAPTLNDFYYTHVGRRNLKPEYTSQYDIGFSLSNSWMSFQSDYYYNTVVDKIICVPNGGSYDWKMINRGYVTTHGVDVATKFFCPYASLTVSGTYQDIRDLTDPEDPDSYNHLFLYSPKLSVTAVASVTYKFFTASLSHMFCSKRYWTYASDDDILDPYNCTDLKIQGSFKHFTLTFECNNIFDIHYELIQRWPLPGRSLGMTLEINL